MSRRLVMSCDQAFCSAELVSAADLPNVHQLRYQAADQGWTTGRRPHGELFDLCPQHSPQGVTVHVHDHLPGAPHDD